MLNIQACSFRNHGAFHEDCTVAIAKRLIAELTSLWPRIGGYWYPTRRHADRRLRPVRPAPGWPLATGDGVRRATPPLVAAAIKLRALVGAFDVERAPGLELTPIAVLG